MGLLIGKQAHPSLVADIERVLAADRDILAVVEVRTMLVGHEPGAGLRAGGLPR